MSNSIGRTGSGYNDKPGGGNTAGAAGNSKFTALSRARQQAGLPSSPLARTGAQHHTRAQPGIMKQV